MPENYNFPSNIEEVANKCGCIFPYKGDFQDIVKDVEYEIEHVMITIFQNRQYCTLNENDLINVLRTIYPLNNIKSIIERPSF